jgi:hypothetical protein
MKKVLAVLVVLTLLALAVPGASYAQAYGLAFTTSITYQNVGTGTAHIVALFYDSPTDTSPVSITRPDLAPKASTSLYIGSLSQIASGFRGSAVFQSDQPVVATMVQLPQGSTTVKNRPLSNGFGGGSSQVLIATVLKNWYNTTSIFSIQNAGAAETTLDIRFYDTAANEVHSASAVVKPGAAYYFDAGQAGGLGSQFNGSAVVTASPADTSVIVGGVMELSTNAGGTAASAFEGVASGAKKFYMPSALCNAWGSNTAYAVQNTDLTQATSVTVTYSNGNTETQSIGAGAKKSFIACNASGMPAGFSGSAVVTSTATDIIAIGKAYGSGLSTAFVGASSGGAEVALPYVRWAKDSDYAAGNGQRVFLTIQNIGSTDLAAGAVTVKYIKFDGVQDGSTHSLPAIAAGAKTNSNASNAGLTEFGKYGSTYGGGAIIEAPAGAELAVVARVSTQVSAGQYASEDYNGMMVP